MQVHIKSKYLDDDAEVKLGYYGNGELALQLFSPVEGPLSTATINLQDYAIAPPEGALMLSNYGPNEGLPQALIEAGLITRLGEYFSFGYVTNGAVVGYPSKELAQAIADFRAQAKF